MGVQVTNSTMPGAVTPTCNECGIALCWDVCEEEYAVTSGFWDAWICRDCNGGEALSLKRWIAEQIAICESSGAPSAWIAGLSHFED